MGAPALEGKRFGWLLLFLAALLALGMWSDGLAGYGGDNALYILLAKSLATGQGYRAIWEPGEPLFGLVPFGFPLLLAPVVAIGGPHAFGAMHLWIIGWAMAALLLWAFWARRETTPWIAWAGVGLLATSLLWIQACGQILSEFPYLAASMASLVFARRYLKQDRAATRCGAGLSLCFLAAYFIRPAGAILIAAVAAWLFWETLRAGNGRLCARRAAFLGAWLVPPLLAWHLRSRWLVPEGAVAYRQLFWLRDLYQPDLGALTWPGLLERIIRNAQDYLAAIGAHLALPPFLWTDAIALGWGLLLASLMAVGWVRRLAARSPSEWMVAAYLPLALMWPVSDPRYLMPVWPWLILYLLTAGRRLMSLAPRIWAMRRVALAVLAIGNLAGCAWAIGLNLAGGCPPPVLREFLKAHRWAREQLPSDAVILSRKPTITALLTDRKAVGIPLIRDAEKFLSELKRHGVTHLLVDQVFPETRWYLVPAVNRHPELFKEVGPKFEAAFLLRFRPPGDD